MKGPLCSVFFYFILLIILGCNEKANPVPGDKKSDFSAKFGTIHHAGVAIRFDDYLNVWGGLLVSVSEGDKALIKVNSSDVRGDVAGFNTDRSHINGEPIMLSEGHNAICVGSYNAGNNEYDQDREYKLEVDNMPLVAKNASKRSPTDVFYVKKYDGIECFDLPSEIVNNKKIKKIQLVFWRSKIVDLRIKIWVVRN